jgi:hypothetical protein
MYLAVDYTRIKVTNPSLFSILYIYQLYNRSIALNRSQVLIIS